MSVFCKKMQALNYPSTVFSSESTPWDKLLTVIQMEVDNPENAEIASLTRHYVIYENRHFLTYEDESDLLSLPYLFWKHAAITADWEVTKWALANAPAEDINRVFEEEIQEIQNRPETEKPWGISNLFERLKFYKKNPGFKYCNMPNGWIKLLLDL